MARPPLKRQDLQAASGVPAIDAEVRAQVEHRKRREARRRREARPRASYDLPLALIEAIQGISDAESVSQSDLAAWALIAFVRAYVAGEVDLEMDKVHARSLRYRYQLELPDMPEVEKTRCP